MRTLLVVAFAVLCGAGPARADVSPAVSAAPPVTSGDWYVLQPGDVLEVKFFYNPELNQAQPVRPDGRISLELIGDAQAAGKTVEQLRGHLAERYAATLKQPEVVVIVKEVAPRRIYVGGEVNSPGLLRVPGSLTALQAIFEAGGFKRSGQMKQVVILRYQGTPEPLFMTLDLKSSLNKGGPARDVPLQPFDVVWVPKTRVAKLNDFVDQYFRQLTPVPVVLGLNYMFGGATFIP